MRRDSILNRARRALANALGFGIAFPRVDDADRSAVARRTPHGTGHRFTTRDHERRADRPLQSEASLVEPTDPDRIPPLEFVGGAPFHIAKGTVTTIYGLGGVGKTSFAAALGTSIAVGRDFLGASVRQGRVFYGEFEGAGQLLARSTRKLKVALEQDEPGSGDVLKSNFVQRHYTAKEKADWGYARGMIPAISRQLGNDFDVVILDSYEGTTMGDSNDAREAAEMMQLFLQLAAETNTAVVVIDHAPKHNPSSVFGSTKKTDFARVVIHIAAQDGGDGHYLTLRSAKCNVAPKPEFPRVERQETDDALRFVQHTSFTVSFGQARDPSTRDRTERQIHDAITSGAKNRTQIYEFIQIEEGLKSIDTARKRVKEHGFIDLLPPEQRGHKREA
mgnify:CR=1 FL=1